MFPGAPKRVPHGECGGLTGGKDPRLFKGRIMGRFKRTEGPPAHGEGYHKRMIVMLKLENQGAGAIQKEIQELWEEIQLRTDCLVEYEIAQASDNKVLGGGAAR